MTDLPTVLARIDADLTSAIDRLFALLRVPSISTDPAYAADCRRAAELIAADLSSLGFAASVRESPGQPFVVAHYTGAGPDKPHALFYAHYDVQPVDPLNLWDSPPFEPVLKDRPDGSRYMVARGPADDKGQMYTFVEAARAYIAETGGLPINITVFLEGEEESGSPSMLPFLAANKAELARDFALVCDTGLWDRDTPSIPTSLRGLVGEEITIRAASRDLHSGLYGSAARNPNHVLAAILASLHDADGRVTVPGFYDDVDETAPEILEEWKSLGFSEADFLGAVGLKQPAGETGRSVLEMTWARPTCEINGMIGGYTGDGFKTVIPAIASAKVSMRLVGRMDPAKIRAAFRAHVRALVPADCEVIFAEHGASPAILIPADNAIVAAGRAALADEWGKPPVRTGSGGSIPVVGWFKTVLGMDSLLVGFANDDDAIHSPNEKYELKSYHKGIRSWARILEQLGR